MPGFTFSPATAHEERWPLLFFPSFNFEDSLYVECYKWFSSQLKHLTQNIHTELRN